MLGQINFYVTLIELDFQGIELDKLSQFSSKLQMVDTCWCGGTKSWYEITIYTSLLNEPTNVNLVDLNAFSIEN